MSTTEIIVIIAGIFSFFLGIVPYILATLNGTVQPNRITWLLWSVPLIAIAVQYENNLLTMASLPVFLAGFGPLCVFIASFFNPKSYWKLGKFDYLCGILGLFTLIFYLISHDAITSITLAIATDALGAIPTIKKAYTHPKSEIISPFLIFFFFTILSFFTMERLDYEEVSFPLYLVIVDSIMIYLLRNQLFEMYKKIKKYIQDNTKQ